MNSMSNRRKVHEDAKTATTAEEKSGGYAATSSSVPLNDDKETNILWS
jgi:hypothetical protein